MVLFSGAAECFMANRFSHLYGHLALGLALLATCVLSLTGLLRQPDMWFYDQVVDRLPAGADRASQPMLSGHKIWEMPETCTTLSSRTARWSMGLARLRVWPT